MTGGKELAHLFEATLEGIVRGLHFGIHNMQSSAGRLALACKSVGGRLYIVCMGRRPKDHQVGTKNWPVLDTWMDVNQRDLNATFGCPHAPSIDTRLSLRRTLPGGTGGGCEQFDAARREAEPQSISSKSGPE